MRLLFLDTETYAIEGCLGSALPLVCVTYAFDDDPPKIVLAKDSLFLAEELLRSDDVLLIGHNISFDAIALAEYSDVWFKAIFRQYDRLKVACTKIREVLHLIEMGVLQDEPRALPGTSLAACAETYAGIQMSKGEDTWRLRYGELDGVPVASWPKEAREYAELDVSALRQVWRQHPCKSPDLLRQSRASFCMALMSANGILVDGERTLNLKRGLLLKKADHAKALVDAGLLKATRKGLTRDMKLMQRLVEDAYASKGLPAPKTESGLKTATGSDSLEPVADVSPVLLEYLAYGKAEKMLSTFVAPLEASIGYPLQPGWNALVATGRTSCGAPNLQNQPTSGGIRECFKPRDGHVFIGGDYSTAELRSLASAMAIICDAKGGGALGHALNSGLDPHLMLGAQLIGTSFDDIKRRYKAGDPVAKNARQRAKAGNFGFPGGLGANTFRAYGKGYGLDLSEAQAKDVRNTWMSTWPEARVYLQFISRLTSANIPVTQIRSNRVRGGCTYTSAANTYFQGLTSDGVKEALWLIIRACYFEANSPLFGSRVLAVVHDEFLLDTQEDVAHEAIVALKELMLSGMSRFVPDIRCEADMRASRRWNKEAKEVHNENGRIIPYEDSL